MPPPEPVEVRERWRTALDEYLDRDERTRALRAELAEARAAGLRARHAARLARMGQKLTPRPVTSSTRKCLVAGCAERPAADVLICARHAQALRPTPKETP